MSDDLFFSTSVLSMLNIYRLNIEKNKCSLDNEEHEQETCSR